MVCGRTQDVLHLWQLVSVVAPGTWHVTCTIAVALMATAHTHRGYQRIDVGTAVVSVTVALLFSILIFAPSLDVNVSIVIAIIGDISS